MGDQKFIKDYFSKTLPIAPGQIFSDGKPKNYFFSHDLGPKTSEQMKNIFDSGFLYPYGYIEIPHVKYFDEESGDYILDDSKGNKLYPLLENNKDGYSSGGGNPVPGIFFSRFNNFIELNGYMSSLDDDLTYSKYDGCLFGQGFMYPIETILDNYTLNFQEGWGGGILKPYYSWKGNIDDFFLESDNDRNEIIVRANRIPLEYAYFYIGFNEKDIRDEHKTLGDLLKQREDYYYTVKYITEKYNTKIVIISNNYVDPFENKTTSQVFRELKETL